MRGPQPSGTSGECKETQKGNGAQLIISTQICFLLYRKGELFGIRNLLRVTGGHGRSCLTKDIEKRQEELERKVRQKAKVSLSVAEYEVEDNHHNGGDVKDPFNIGIEEDLRGNIVYTHLNDMVVGGSKGEEELSRNMF